jgi:hypothetical protein
MICDLCLKESEIEISNLRNDLKICKSCYDEIYPEKPDRHICKPTRIGSNPMRGKHERFGD